MKMQVNIMAQEKLSTNPGLPRTEGTQKASDNSSHEVKVVTTQGNGQSVFPISYQSLVSTPSPIKFGPNSPLFSIDYNAIASKSGHAAKKLCEFGIMGGIMATAFLVPDIIKYQKYQPFPSNGAFSSTAKFALITNVSKNVTHMLQILKSQTVASTKRVAVLNSAKEEPITESHENSEEGRKQQETITGKQVGITIAASFAVTVLTQNNSNNKILALESLRNSNQQNTVDYKPKPSNFKEKGMYIFGGLPIRTVKDLVGAGCFVISPAIREKMKESFPNHPLFATGLAYALIAIPGGLTTNALNRIYTAQVSEMDRVSFGVKGIGQVAQKIVATSGGKAFLQGGLFYISMAYAMQLMLPNAEDAARKITNVIEKGFVSGLLFFSRQRQKGQANNVPQEPTKDDFFRLGSH
jgi:hypothetical protein